MKRAPILIVLTLLPPLTLADDEPLREQAAATYVNEQCSRSAEDLLRGFSSPDNPARQDILQTCTCTLRAVRGKTWESTRQLDLAAARALQSCAKPIAYSYGKRWVRTKFEPFFADRGWSAAQIDAFTNCGAERLWNVSLRNASTGDKAQIEDVRSLVNDCSARVVQ